MSFSKGRASFQRLGIDDVRLLPFKEFGQTQLDRLGAYTQTVDGPEVSYCWGGGDHSRDTAFSLEKNVVDNTLAFDLVIVTDRPPPELMRSYYAIELKALAASNPSGFASAKQKREARQVARERIEQEAKDGRFRRRRVVPVLWDIEHAEILFGATSAAHLGGFCQLFNQTFGVNLRVLDADWQADYLGKQYPDLMGEPMPAFDKVEPIWSQRQLDFLGNEMLMWLWWTSTEVGDTVDLLDVTELTFMFSKTLTLDCPRGQTGRETFTHDSPIRLPEAFRGLRSGKRPRRAGFICVRNNLQFEFVLSAEDFSVSGLKLPAPGDDATTVQAQREHRVAMLREFLMTMDLLFTTFLTLRFGPQWSDVHTSMMGWLNG
jgi:hypothetical protein